MKRLLLAPLLFGLSFLFPALFSTSTLAEGKDGNFYLEIGGGYQFPQVTTIKAPISGTTYKLDYEFDGSGVYGLGLGYDFGQWRLHGSVSKGTLSLDSIKLDGSKLAITVEDIEVTMLSLGGIYELTKDSKITPFIGSGLSFQTGSDALTTVQTGGKTTNLTVSGDEIWAVQLNAGLTYEIKEDIDFYASLGYAIPLKESNLPAGWTEESPNVIGYIFGLIYSF
tara:strand:+ start:74 stop:745 length:672 start_codon:yes stop_codon:yes gene_type:complete